MNHERHFFIYAIMMCVFIMVMIIPVSVNAGTHIPENVMMSVDGAAASPVRGINASYDNNVYISLRALRDRLIPR